MDIVYLHGLRIKTIIGLWEWERKLPQSLIVDLDLGLDTAKAGHSDAVEDTIDYKSVADRVMALATQSKFQLVEAFAETMATALLDDFDIEWVRIKIYKQGAVRNVHSVGVIIERERKV